MLVARRYDSLKELIQSQLSDLTGPAAGVGIVLPHLARIDIYTMLGSSFVESEGAPTKASPEGKPPRELLENLTWVLAYRANEGWVAREVDEKLKGAIITSIAPA